MRIAFLVDSCIGYLPTFILNQIEGLVDLGVDVHIFCECSPKDEKIERRSWNLGNRAHYFIKIPQNKFKRILKALLLITEVIYRNPLPILRALNIFRYGKDSLTLKNLFYAIPFIGNKYDILHCHYGPVGLEYVILKDILRVKYIVTIHGFDITKFVKQEGKDIYTPLFKPEVVFMPVSRKWKNKLIRLGCTQKIIVHHMGIDLQKFTFFSREVLQDKMVKILTVARLAEKKGLKYSIRAFAKTIQEYQNIKYEIVGDGPLRNELNRLINDLKISKKVKLIGWKSSKEVRKLMKNSHIFILPSVTASNGDMEGIPVALMEAQASGIPVISTYHSGIPEIVEDEKSGFLVPERNVEALTEKLTYLIEHPEIWPIMGRAGRKIVEKEFDIKKLSKGLVKIYNELL